MTVRSAIRTLGLLESLAQRSRVPRPGKASAGQSAWSARLRLAVPALSEAAANDDAVLAPDGRACVAHGLSRFVPDGPKHPRAPEPLS